MSEQVNTMQQDQATTLLSGLQDMISKLKPAESTAEKLDQKGPQEPAPENTGFKAIEGQEVKEDKPMISPENKEKFKKGVGSTFVLGGKILIGAAIVPILLAFAGFVGTSLGLGLLGTVILLGIVGGALWVLGALTLS